MTSHHASQAVTPELRQWILEQSQAGHDPQAVLQAMQRVHNCKHAHECRATWERMTAAEQDGWVRAVADIRRPWVRAVVVLATVVAAAASEWASLRAAICGR